MLDAYNFWWHEFDDMTWSYLVLGLESSNQLMLSAVVGEEGSGRGIGIFHYLCLRTVWGKIFKRKEYKREIWLNLQSFKKREKKVHFWTDWQIPTIVVKLRTIYRFGIFLLLYFSLKIEMYFVIFKVLLKILRY